MRFSFSFLVLPIVVAMCGLGIIYYFFGAEVVALVVMLFFTAGALVSLAYFGWGKLRRG